MSKESISFLCQELKENIKNWGSLSAKWVVPFSEIMDKWANSKAENDLISSVSDWVANSEQTPEYDGNYLCYINQPQECGNVWRYYKTVYREMGKWVLDDDEEVIFWTDKAFPKHISPEPPCR